MVKPSKQDSSQWKNEDVLVRVQLPPHEEMGLQSLINRAANEVDVMAHLQEIPGKRAVKNTDMAAWLDKPNRLTICKIK